MKSNIFSLLMGIIIIFFVGVGATVALPFFDEAMSNPTPNARPYTADELAGRKLYIREGCQVCHTQQVRPVAADANLGPVSRPGDYYYDSPHLLGSNRTGPDLKWVGAKPLTREWHIEHLRDPRSIVPGSIMPSYRYLSEEELNLLVTYLLSLKPAEQ